MYGDFDDIPPGVVMYLDVQESSFTDPVPPPRYGAPEVTVNTLDFDPAEFAAFSASTEGGGADLFDGQLNFDIMVFENATGVAGGITSLVFEEGGDFSLFGAGTSVTAVIAGLGARVDILEVDGNPLASPLPAVVGTAQFTADLASSPGFNQDWGNTLFVDLAAALNSAGIDYELGVTKAEVVIDDTLGAISEVSPSTIAAIAKKDFKVYPGDVVPNPDFVIPEPASVVLLSTLLAGAWGYRRFA